MGRLYAGLFFLALATGALAQVPDTTGRFHPRGYPGFHHDEITLLVGYHQGRYGFAEFGIGRNIHGAMHYPYGLGYHLGAEVRVDRTDIVGLKAGIHITCGGAMGVHFIHYMEGDHTMQVLRPEFGIGLFKGKMTYAYNWRLTKPVIDGVSAHMLSFAYAFRLKRLPRDDVRQGRP